MNSNYKRYTDFWNPSDDSWVVDSFLNDDQPIVKKGKDHVALAGYRRAISNFVNIISGQSIPVTFKGRDSYTDFEKVVLSGNINEKNFDFNCGLAMHEGSHLVYTDRDALKNTRDIMKEVLGATKNKYSWNNNLYNLVKKLTNYIEDRRIDSIVYKSAPGYRGYYQALYKKYFDARSITKAFKTKSYANEPTVANYMFYIAGMTNQWCDSSDLPNLKEMFNVIDLNNVSRLKNTTEVIRVAVVVAKMIIKEVLKKHDDEADNTDISEAMNQYEDKDDSGAELYPDATLTTEDGKLSNSTAQSAFDKVKDLIDGNVKKTQLTNKDISSIQGIEASGSEYKDVEVEGTLHKVLLVKKLTPEMISTGYMHRGTPGPVNIFTYKQSWGYTKERVEDALRLGSVLGRKLQIRNEDRTLKYTRKDAGRIDKRLIAELGFQNSNVFSKTLVTNFKKASLHLTIDFSGSMSGTKLNNAITSAIAIAKAASMVSNINVVISSRNTTWNRSSDQKPMVVVLYDSKTNKLSHIRKYFPFLRSAGLTPEGLCFEALKKVISDNQAEDNYFVNYSDGQPYSPGYAGSTAVFHTRKAVDNIKHSGTKVLSYFITDEYIYDRCKSDFKMMYGKDAKFVNPTNMMDVARSLNQAFLGK